MMNEEGDTGKTVPTHNIIRTYLHATLFSIPSSSKLGNHFSSKKQKEIYRETFFI